MLPHDTAHRKEQALPPHMAVWLPQGWAPAFQAQGCCEPFQWPVVGIG